MIQISEALRKDMVRKGIDIALTTRILEDYNSGFYDAVKPVKAKGVPPIDGSTVIDLRLSGNPDAILFSAGANKARANLEALGIDWPASLRDIPDSAGPNALAHFSAACLEGIGTALLPRTAFGVLNGGSATSYADRKKNLALGKAAFDAVEEGFETLAPQCRDMPKGMTPAYVNPDGSPGASFLELKMRARLLLAQRYNENIVADKSEKAVGASPAPFLPLFQMTSLSNDGLLSDHYAKAAFSPFLATLSETTGLEAAAWSTGVQPMIAAYSHSEVGRPKRIFSEAHGKPDSSLPLPGGHGQCFRVLKGTLEAMRDKGVRFACLGNVDNLGYTPNPVELAIMALSGRSAAFDFAVRTPMDVKGGILVETTEGGLTVADIGPAISFDALLDLESQGHSILFNCASGIFDLDYLVPRIDEIARMLPVRFSDQDKDAGRYSQAEQVTWEVTGILPSFLAFAVDKKERFLAAKLLLDTLLTSGIGLDKPGLPEDLRRTAASMHEGLASMLRRVYGLELSGGRWLPRELLAD
jgi:UDP-N-acetylglucosamine pyrophosphorylase